MLPLQKKSCVLKRIPRNPRRSWRSVQIGEISCTAPPPQILLLRNSQQFSAPFFAWGRSEISSVSGRNPKGKVSFLVWIPSCFGRSQVREVEDNFRAFEKSLVCIRDDSACQTAPKNVHYFWHFRLLSINIFTPNASKIFHNELMNVSCINWGRDQLVQVNN